MDINLGQAHNVTGLTPRLIWYYATDLQWNDDTHWPSLFLSFSPTGSQERQEGTWRQGQRWGSREGAWHWPGEWPSSGEWDGEYDPFWGGQTGEERHTGGYTWVRWRNAVCGSILIVMIVFCFAVCCWWLDWGIQKWPGQRPLGLDQFFYSVLWL